MGDILNPIWNTKPAQPAQATQEDPASAAALIRTLMQQLQAPAPATPAAPPFVAPPRPPLMDTVQGGGARGFLHNLGEALRVGGEAGMPPEEFSRMQGMREQAHREDVTQAYQQHRAGIEDVAQQQRGQAEERRSKQGILAELIRVQQEQEREREFGRRQTEVERANKAREDAAGRRDSLSRLKQEALERHQAAMESIAQSNASLREKQVAINAENVRSETDFRKAATELHTRAADETERKDLQRDTDNWVKMMTGWGGTIQRSLGTAPTPTKPARTPKAGDVEDGHRFRGGDPADAKNWEVVKPSAKR